MQVNIPDMDGMGLAKLTFHQPSNFLTNLLWFLWGILLVFVQYSTIGRVAIGGFPTHRSPFSMRSRKVLLCPSISFEENLSSWDSQKKNGLYIRNCLEIYFETLKVAPSTPRFFADIWEISRFSHRWWHEKNFGPGTFLKTKHLWKTT